MSNDFFGGGDSTARGRSRWGYKNPFISATKVLTNSQLADRKRTISFPINGASISVGTPTLAAQGSNKDYQAWSMVNGANSTITCTAQIPLDMYSGGGSSYTGIAITNSQWRIYWANLGAGAGNVVWQVGYTFAKNLGPLNVSLVSDSVTGTSSGQDTLVTSTVAPSALPGTSSTFDIIVLQITRNGLSGSDTLANAAGLLGVTLVYWADM